jgi:hypothetical protein
VSEVVVHFAQNELDAQTAAGALRANRLHPRVSRDPTDAMLGVAGGISMGRFVVLVPDREARIAREILQPPKGRRRARR